MHTCIGSCVQLVVESPCACLASLWHRVTFQSWQLDTIWCWSSSSHPSGGCGIKSSIPSRVRSAEAKKLLVRPCAVVYRVFCLQQLSNDGVCCMQVSDQCVKLVKAGWFDVQKEPSGVSTLTNPSVRPQGTSACPQPCITVELLNSQCLPGAATIVIIIYIVNLL